MQLSSWWNGRAKHLTLGRARPIRSRRGWSRSVGFGVSVSPRELARSSECLESRRLLSAAFPEFADPHDAPGNQFGSSLAVLTNGNVVITSPFDDAGGTDAGAVYLFNGVTGSLISSLMGSHSNDNIGSAGVVALSNGNFAAISPQWDNGTTIDAGAVTFGNGTTGVSGVVGSTNSLVGSATGDQIGSGGVTPLSNGNYIVSSPHWHNGLLADAGAVTFGSGQTGAIGAITTANSAVGLTANTSLQPVVLNNVTNTFYARFLTEGSGKVRVGSQFSGFATDTPVVGASDTEITLDGSNNLVVTDINGGTSNDTLTIKSDTANNVFVINDSVLTISTNIAGATGSGTSSVSGHTGP